MMVTALTIGSIVLLIALIAAVARLVVFGRRMVHVMVVKEVADRLLDQAEADPYRMAIVEALRNVVERADVRALLEGVAADAKLLFGADHAEITLIAQEGNYYVAGDTVTASKEPRLEGYCRLVLTNQPVVVDDSRDFLMLFGNPYVEHVRSYLGCPLRDESKVVGSLCVYGAEPREWTAEDKRRLSELADTVSGFLAGQRAPL